jgi:Zn-dependent M28 family amino/carboxypeptidase
MRSLVEALCSDRCAGRKPGTPGGQEARGLVKDALQRAGLDPYEQEVPGCRGANVIAKIAGDIDRYVVIGAHFDHLGSYGGDIYRGADDNAAAVAILVEAAQAVARKKPAGRGVIIAAFDGEEPPYFLTGGMGSQRFVKEPPVPLPRVDMMVCMDLVGHALGPAGVPGEVRSSLFALGAERSRGTGELVDRIARAEDGVVIRRADVEIIPPLSDYEPFWRREVPFLFLTSGRARYYHTPQDTPDKLDYDKMAATARWLERFVRETCARDEAEVKFQGSARDDASMLRSIASLTGALAAVSQEAEAGRSMAEALLAACDKDGRLPQNLQSDATMLVGMIEQRLA